MVAAPVDDNWRMHKNKVNPLPDDYTTHWTKQGLLLWRSYLHPCWGSTGTENVHAHLPAIELWHTLKTAL